MHAAPGYSSPSSRGGTRLPAAQRPTAAGENLTPARPGLRSGPGAGRRYGAAAGTVLVLASPLQTAVRSLFEVPDTVPALLWADSVQQAMTSNTAPSADSDTVSQGKR